MDIIAVAASAAVLAAIAASFWYQRWCDRNGVPRPAGSSGGDGPDFSDGGDGD